MQIDLIPREYRPELITRRGEWIAWSLVLLLGTGWGIRTMMGQPPNFVFLLVTVILLFAAASISLGNWIDRRTVIQLNTTGIKYTNGLRHVNMNWDELQDVRVLPAQWGKKVQVIGDTAYFGFHTLGEVLVQGDVKGRVGFEKGDEIVRQIVENCRLVGVERPGKGYYYTRE